jgi:DNA-binding MarR family transcriptional regulator
MADDPRTPGGYVLAETLSHLLRRSHFHAEALFAATLGRRGVTSRQLALMVAAAQAPGSTQRGLAEHVALDMNTASDLLRRMEARGYVGRRRSDADARSQIVELTEAGAALLEDIVRENAAYQDGLAGALTEGERAELKRLLRKMLGM